MSTQPAYDEPWGNVEPATEADIRDLIDHIVKSAVPRAGKTAVARIAKPLTDTLLAFRRTLVEDVGAGYAAWARIAKRLDDDRETLTVEQIEQRVHEALDLLPAPVDPPQLGEVIASNERLAEVARHDGVVIVGGGALVVSDHGEWYLPGSPAVAHPDLSVRWVVERVPGGAV